MTQHVYNYTMTAYMKQRSSWETNSRLVKKFSAFYGTWKFTAFTSIDIP
jgi:hypothetical protein